MDLLQKGYNLSIALQNFNMSYDDVGQGNKTIIFLHGFPFDKSTWQLQMAYLETSFRCIAIDIRGFGKSTYFENNLSIDLFTDDLIHIMDALRIEKAVICGLSMGGYIALNAVKKHADRIDALVFCDTQCIADSSEAKEKRYKTIEDISNNGKSNFVNKFTNSIFCEHTHNNKPEIVANVKTLVSANAESIIISGLKALANRSETCSVLPEIQMPTLIVCGQEDALTPVSQSEFMHQQIKGSKLHVIENAGHMSNLEQEDEFNKVIHQFLNSLDQN